MVARRSWTILLRLPVRGAAVAVVLLPSYALMAYVLLPASWRLQNAPFYREGEAASVSRVTRTAEGIPSDPLNVALVGTRLQVLSAMRAAGWHRADRISLRSGWRDAQSVLLDRPYPTAPMSTQYVAERPQDLAFEQTIGSPRRRHHVRFWRVSSASSPAETIWLGAATYDLSVGVSRFTGEVMHHIDPNVDSERDKLLSDLSAASRVAGIRYLDSFQARMGQNGGGDGYRTDGRLGVAVLGSPR